MIIFGGFMGILSILLFYWFKMFTTSIPDIKLSQLDPQIQDWLNRGRLVDVLGHTMFAIDQNPSIAEAIILIHGFPTSSFDYKKSIDLLSKDYRVVTFDHLGFGFSAKPQENYTYSLVDQAEQALNLWRILGIKSANIVSHDMGDSILTEILSRYERGVLPDYFNNFFKKIIFTNGGMKYDLINFRLSQSLLMSPVGPYLSKLTKINELVWLTDFLSTKQLKTIWSPEYLDENEMENDMKQIQMINRYKNGNALTHLTISYLRDRSRFESRWMSSLERIQIPILLLWGDSDAVSPLTIPRAVSRHIQPEFVTMETMKGVGHFIMLEEPMKWTRHILQFIKL